MVITYAIYGPSHTLQTTSVVTVSANTLGAMHWTIIAVTAIGYSDPRKGCKVTYQSTRLIFTLALYAEIPFEFHLLKPQTEQIDRHRIKNRSLLVLIDVIVAMNNSHRRRHSSSIKPRITYSNGLYHVLLVHYADVASLNLLVY